MKVPGVYFTVPHKSKGDGVDICTNCRIIGGWHRPGCPEGDAEIDRMFAMLAATPTAHAIDAIEVPTRDIPSATVHVLDVPAPADKDAGR